MSKVLNITLYGVNFLINEILYCNNQSTKQASGMGIFHSIILHIIIDTFSMSRSVLFVCLFVCSIVSLFVCLFHSFFFLSWMLIPWRTWEDWCLCGTPIPIVNVSLGKEKQKLVTILRHIYQRRWLTDSVPACLPKM